MNYPDLPNDIQQGVQRFAQERHISQHEAVLFLLKAGLQHAPATDQPKQGRNPAEELIGLFSSDEDAALMDEVVALAYEGRRVAAVGDSAV